MRTRLGLSACVACMLLAAGCFDSLTSIATDEKVVFYDDLVGDYRAVAPATGRMSLEKREGKAYAFTQEDENEVVQSRGTMRIVKLGEELFYELSATDYKTVDGKPLYVIGRLVLEGEPGKRKVAGYTFASSDRMTSDPEVSTADYTTKYGGEERQGKAVSMPAEKLQKFLAAHAKEMSEATLRYERIGG